MFKMYEIYYMSNIRSSKNIKIKNDIKQIECKIFLISKTMITIDKNNKRYIIYIKYEI